MQNDFANHGLVLGGMHSSCGKTTVTCLLLAALRRRNIPIQPCKAGPDFIDPAYHARISGVATRNLDGWLMGLDGVQAEVAAHGRDKLSVLEGVMGLFDGGEPDSDAGSTLELARQLDWPVILVVPAEKAGRSLAMAIKGFIEEAGRDRIQGLIFNRVQSAAHQDYLRRATASLSVPVLGAVPPAPALQWPERHLGLQAVQEQERPSVDELADLGEQYLDIEGILGSSRPGTPARSPSAQTAPAGRAKAVHIGIAMDEAFHFYYQANLDYLRDRGATLHFFSPIHDPTLPPGLDGLLFGGGFPEVYAADLAANRPMQESVRRAIGDGLPCYAECGGLLYLSERLVDSEDRAFPMCGLVPGTVAMTPGLQDFGYSECQLHRATETEAHRGHEFHYSRWVDEPEHANLWVVTKRRGRRRQEGFRQANLHASYVHLYFPQSRPLIDRLFFDSRAAGENPLKPERDPT